MKPKSFLWVFLLLFGTGSRAFSQSYILTDASGGIFREDQQLSFSLSSPGRLRILVDNREIYYGAGPAFPEIGLPAGEERGFTLCAEYYSPDNTLAESRNWYIFIDKKPPPVPKIEFHHTDRGLGLVQGEGETVKIRVWADVEGSLSFFPDLGELIEGGLLPADSFPALVWAEDLAGNCSGPVYEFFRMPPVKLENPVPGKWLNSQTLVISGAEGKDIYWTIDGSGPLDSGGTGRLYRGPERIEKSGQITLRIAWRDSAGRIMEDRADYSVEENSPGGAEESLAALKDAEEKPLAGITALELPKEWLWSIGGVPRDHSMSNISLRPESLIKRTAVLQLSPPGRSMADGLYRFVYLLDGTGETPEASPPAPDFVTPMEAVFQPTGLRLVSAGRCRLLVWPETYGTVYYSWEGAAHLSRGPRNRVTGPLPVGPEGGTLYWYVSQSGNNEPSSGEIFGAAVEPLTRVKRENPSGRIACRRYDEKGKSGWNFVSGLLRYSPGIVNTRAQDVCDGEDLEWAFISSGGKILEKRRRDRLAPLAPEFDAIPEGGWTRGPLKVGVVPCENDETGYISARIKYTSGAVEVLSGIGFLDIVSSLDEAAEVTLIGMAMDSSGNRSPNVVRSFTLDPKIVYVSVSPAVPGSRALPPGGMDNPFSSLEEAMDYALRQERSVIRIAGTFELRKPVTLSNNLHITGAVGGSALVLHEDFCWKLNPGAGLTLSGLRAERKKGSNPLIQAGKGSRLEILAASLINTGPLVLMDGAECRIRDSWIVVAVSGEQRTAALSGRESGLNITNTRIQLEGNYSLVFDLKEGNFSAGNSVFLSAGLRTASIFALDGTRANLSNLTLSAAAQDYASVLEASRSDLVLQGGTMRVSARDTSAILLDHSPALLLNTELRLEGGFSAKAAEIRGQFPRVQNSGFFSTGTAKRSEVFSGTDAVPPPAESLAGNRFTGFTQIWGRNP